MLGYSRLSDGTFGFSLHRTPFVFSVNSKIFRLRPGHIVTSWSHFFTGNDVRVFQTIGWHVWFFSISYPLCLFRNYFSFSAIRRTRWIGNFSQTPWKITVMGVSLGDLGGDSKNSKSGQHKFSPTKARLSNKWKCALHLLCFIRKVNSVLVR